MLVCIYCNGGYYGPCVDRRYNANLGRSDPGRGGTKVKEIILGKPMGRPWENHGKTVENLGKP